eukprot:scaffold36419_cov62-Phaeocystis_antarctica.AAC.2
MVSQWSLTSRQLTEISTCMCAGPSRPAAPLRPKCVSAPRGGNGASAAPPPPPAAGAAATAAAGAPLDGAVAGLASGCEVRKCRKTRRDECAGTRRVEKTLSAVLESEKLISVSASRCLLCESTKSSGMDEWFSMTKERLT